VSGAVIRPDFSDEPEPSSTENPRAAKVQEVFERLTGSVARPQYPQIFGNYVLDEMMSRGGMAEIFRAQRTGPQGFRKTVALKKILPTLGRSDDFKKMFIAEARLLSFLDHPNIVQVHELGEVAGEMYMAMEYVDGYDLKTLVRQATQKGLTLPLDLSVYIAAKVAWALDFAFQRPGPDGKPLEIVHRDVSPANVLVSFQGTVKLADFGIARPSHTVDKPHAPQGRVQYMSPEQAKGGVLDARSDIFSLGIILYELVAGRRPFAGGSEHPSLDQVRNADVVPLRFISTRVTPRLEKVVMKALSTSPEDRYADAGQMAAALDRVLHERPSVGSSHLAQFMRIVFDATSRHKEHD
jgi:serine/threonine-protein kinase